MKKLLAIILAMALSAALFGCNFGTVGWRSVDIESGTIRVPKDWTLSYDNDLMYFYCGNDDSKDNVVAFQSNSFGDFKENTDKTEGIVESNAFSNQFQCLYTISSAVISNSAIYGEAMVSVDGTEYKMRYIDVSFYENYVQFFVRNDMVEEDTFMKIAKSYVSI